MQQKHHSTEEIIRILRQADTDQTVESVCREYNISKATFHRWKRKYGDMDIADAKRLKELEKENAELKKMLAEAMLKNRVLEEVNSKKWYVRCRKNEPLHTSLARGCARSVGLVGIWGCIGRRIGIQPNSLCPNRSNYISALWHCPGTIPAMAIDVSAPYWRKRVGRSAANRSSTSAAVRG